MRAALLLRLSGTARGYSVRSVRTSVLSKKQITPLIKAIHPDYFMNDDADVKAANLNCVQSLNELWQTMVALEAQLQNKSGSAKEMVIGVPFKARYDLSCFVKNTGQAKGDSSLPLHRVECYIRPHPKTCALGQPISYSLGKYYLHNILTQLDNLYLDIGLEAQFTEADSAEASLPAAEQQSSADAKTDGKDYFDIAEKQLEAVRLELHERAMNLSERVHAAATTVSVLADHSPLAPRVGRQQQRSPREEWAEEMEGGGKQTMHSLKKARKRDEVTYGLFDAELQTFFHSGNVLVKGIDSSEHLAALQKLHKFMSQYGRLLNFRYDRWQRVVFVLAGGTEATFAFDMRGSRSVVTIPSAFTFKEAAAFIQQNLSLSKLTAGFEE